MSTYLRRAFCAAAATGAVFAVPSAAATAQSPPAPGPCGPALSDPEGDMAFTNRDLLAAYLRSDGGVVTASAVLKEITFAAPSAGGVASVTSGKRHEWNEGDSMLYRTAYTAGGRRWYVQAEVIAGAARSTVEYTYGTLDGATPTRVGATTGSVGSGTSAVVSVVLPSETGAVAGATLGGVVVADQNVGNLPGGIKNAEGGDVLPGGTHSGPMPGEVPGAADVVVPDCATGSAGAAVIASVADGRVVAGHSTRLTARVTGAAAGALATLSSVSSKGVVRPVAEKPVAADGRVLFRVRPTRTTTYQVQVGDSRSLPVTVAVSPRIDVSVRGRAGGGLVFSGRITPTSAATLLVERRVDGAWFAEVSGRARKGRYRIAAPRAGRRGIYRVRVRATSSHAAGSSRTVRVS